MPLQSFPMPTKGMTVDQLANVVAQMGRALSYLTGNLDSANIKTIYTDQTDVQSSNGKTVINGTLLEMYDNQSTPVLRIQMGYSSKTSAFVFNMFNEAGTQTVSLDSSGNIQLGGNLSFVDTTESNLEVLSITNAGSGIGYAIKSLNGARLLLNGTTQLTGNVSFSLATIVGLGTNGGETGSAGTPAHTHDIPSLPITA